VRSAACEHAPQSMFTGSPAAETAFHTDVLLSSNPILITDLANLSIHEIDLKHVFR
jgi:hypothetical protein